jgi:hypothetical protein
MVLFGGRRVFLSHIPMMRAPHDVQAVFEIAIRSSATHLPSSFADTLYTFVPEVVSLDALRLGEIHELRGSVFLGNFEDGGRLLSRDVVVDVNEVVFQEELLPSLPAATTLSYLVLGDSSESFLVHRIGGPRRDGAPNFDEIVSVTSSAVSGDAGASQGSFVTLGPSDAVAHRLGAGSGTVGFTVKTNISCLVGPDFVDACP